MSAYDASRRLYYSQTEHSPPNCEDLLAAVKPGVCSQVRSVHVLDVNNGQENHSPHLSLRFVRCDGPISDCFEEAAYILQRQLPLSRILFLKLSAEENPITLHAIVP